ncbi:MAG: hypothetical protein NTW63_01140, partial [Caldiserica bacterium]|nr:hypothetical protein [Caldisericota bacterium]
EQAKEVLRAQEQHLDPVALHDTILADERHLRDLVLTRKHDQPHINPSKGMDWQLHPVSSRF